LDKKGELYRGVIGDHADNTGVVLNVFEAVDVIALIKGGVYDDLNLTVGDALLKRSDVCFQFRGSTMRISY
jgi:hypothetical protein